MKELRDRITNLEQMANTLQTLVDCCSGDQRPDCPILADLEQPADDQPLNPPVGIDRLNRRS